MIAVCSEIHTEEINAVWGQNIEFLGASAKFRKATTSFDMSGCPSFRLPLCPSVRMEQLGSHRTDLYEI